MTNPDPDAVLTDAEFTENALVVAKNIGEAIADIPGDVWALRNVTDFTTLTDDQRFQYQTLIVLADTMAAMTYLSAGLAMDDNTLGRQVIENGLRILSSPRFQHLITCTGDTP